ncbi:unnamed protein product [Lota lota]
MKRFYTVNGCNGSSLRIYEEFKKKLKAKGPTEVTSSDQCDFILAFCPISTRAGIDIQETMEMCPGWMSGRSSRAVMVKPVELRLPVPATKR